MTAPFTYTFVQARLGSTRLPRKVLADIAGQTLLERVMGRAERIGPPVALLIPESDKELAVYAMAKEWVWVYGPEEDVLGRFAEGVRAFQPDHVVRVTADCPFLDVEAARWTVQEHVRGGYDLTTYHQAEGRGVQVFRADALLAADQYASNSARHSPDAAFLPGEDGYGAHGFTVHHVRFSVDTPEDLETARRRAKEE